VRVSRRLPAAVALAVLASLAGPVHALGATPGTPTAAPRLPCADQVVDDPVGGEAAVRELGSDLPEAAANADRSPAAYRRLLRTDATLRVDECAQTFVVEPPQTAAQQAAAEAATADEPPGGDHGGGLDASGNAFMLNSRPGSARTIFLDFDGAIVSGTAWEPAPLPEHAAVGYDVDGSATFSSDEEDVVRNVWLRVAEDYAAFDVNVTTEEPEQAAITRIDKGDDRYGTRVLITTDQPLWRRLCPEGCGGYAYLNVFDDYSAANGHDYYQPALVFAMAEHGSGTSAKGVAEAAAHEVGHTLGLGHDGTTTTPYYRGTRTWAPIMGAGYDANVTQWSQGEYAGASNHEDDLAVMALHGVDLVADDHGSTAGTATILPYDGDVEDGLIGTRDDSDWFAFTVPRPTGAQSLITTTVQVSPQIAGGDLDARLTIYDSQRTAVADVDTLTSAQDGDRTDGLDASFSDSLPAGLYTARVDGTGSGDAAGTGYSDYASLGRYTIRVTDEIQPFTAPATVTPGATVGVPYSTRLTAVGGTAPFAWSTSEAPSPGLTLADDGTVSGMPTTAGTTSSTVQVVSAAGASIDRPLVVTVTAPAEQGATGSTTPPEPPAQTTPTPTPTVTQPTTAPSTPPTTPPIPRTFTGTLRTAVAALPVKAETAAGYATARFPLVDADRDCRSTRTEVLQAESRRGVSWTSKRHCTVRNGRWTSLFDRRTVTRPAPLTAVWTVPLAEAWQSGARGWPTARRRALANDLADPRTLRAVTTRSATYRANREPARWLPAAASRCTYVADWVAVKIRWGLTADRVEKARLAALARGCAPVRLTVRRT
jgi:Metallo-peptidase family M12B Reprolysin-like